jgi:hypothetical protein
MRERGSAEAMEEEMVGWVELELEEEEDEEEEEEESSDAVWAEKGSTCDGAKARVHIMDANQMARKHHERLVYIHNVTWLVRE